jgi:hypothetical protein
MLIFQAFSSLFLEFAPFIHNEYREKFIGKNTTKKSMAEVNNPAINVIIMTILMNEDQKWLWFENGSYMIESSLVII